VLERLGRHAEADGQYALAEAGWREDAPEPKNLARFLADRGVKVEEAVSIARQAAAERQDIFTEDALAWTCLKTGRLDEAAQASDLALRTGSRDRLLLYHAAAISHARGDDDAARALVQQALDGNPQFDLMAAPAAARLRDELVRAPQVATSR
jgi:tetratricopeptide (TPR) repeat protein